MKVVSAEGWKIVWGKGEAEGLRGWWEEYRELDAEMVWE